jgi:hypothetical protein
MNHKKAQQLAARFTDTAMAGQFYVAVLKAMKPSRQYHDDPEGDKASPYLKGVIAVRDVIVKIIETSHDQALIHEAKKMLNGTMKLLPRTMASWSSKVQEWATEVDDPEANEPATGPMAEIHKRRDARKFGRVKLTDPYLYFHTSDDNGKPKVLRWYMPEKLRAAIAEGERTGDFSFLAGEIALEAITDETQGLEEHEVNWKMAERILSSAMVSAEKRRAT